MYFYQQPNNKHISASYFVIVFQAKKPAAKGAKKAAKQPAKK